MEAAYIYMHPSSILLFEVVLQSPTDLVDHVCNQPPINLP